ncbi:Glycerophosphodiester phosphodiesterase [Alteripontixanthobacter maritimus]|uniref:Glycerophosphodiester phosphodiesterase n=1 Tax=Alteripontixanthobacter maritimus TaxID=2161824 RepID=A0A369QFB3_9SPHN|nr:glycerophosphodiester phosphodiesterase family protein [Alteripontixanthobacter maritimus]RDC60988.1 Glycerophosphodiester phosphodiesterase [Alteripontixanthobacter maritimus]
MMDITWLGEGTYAHRGLHGGGAEGLPIENSRSAFAAAIARGLGIECDVQISQDGEAMVFHDWQLERLTGRAGSVRARNAAELRAFTLKESTDRIQSLPELLDQIDGAVPLLVEIKSRRDRPFVPICAAVERAVSSYGGHVAIMSFDPRISNWFWRNAAHVVRGLVVTEEGRRGVWGFFGRHAALRHARPHFLAYDIRDLPSGFASRQREQGLPVLTWTVNTPELRQLAAQYADAPIAEGAGLP